MSAPTRWAFVALGSNRVPAGTLPRCPLGAPSDSEVAPPAAGPVTGCADVLDWACEELDGLPGVRLVARSNWIRTKPVGGPRGQPDFVNGVVELAVDVEPESLLAACQGIEARAGRDRRNEVHHGPRTLDLDLLLMDGVRRDTEELRLPHPRMEERLFVLEPLGELAPGLVLPGCRRTVSDRVALLRFPSDSTPAPRSLGAASGLR